MEIGTSYMLMDKCFSCLAVLIFDTCRTVLNHIGYFSIYIWPVQSFSCIALGLFNTNMAMMKNLSHFIPQFRWYDDMLTFSKNFVVIRYFTLKTEVWLY